MAVRSIKGMNDIYSPEVEIWEFVEQVARVLFDRFGYREIRTPILEKTELFARSIGTDTDIVEKEMYTFPNSKGELLTMRPEATASIVRAVIQHKLYNFPTLGKFFTIGPMFRHERPQKGRYRQFHQIDAEIIGYKEPMVDADAMYWSMVFLEEIGLDGVELHLNSLGCKQCRKTYRLELTNYLEEFRPSLCPDCTRRVERNPLRVFDCKVQKCKEVVLGAPKILTYLCKECHKHFDKVCFYLDRLGGTYVIDNNLVRGLDYYNRTAFEIITDRLGAQNALGGGGRYDDLFRELGGPDIPAVGFALGIERLILLLKEKTTGKEKIGPALYVIGLGEKGQNLGFSIAQKLRKRGLSVEISYETKSLKSQMRKANKLSALNVLIIGDEEIEKSVAILRNMNTKEQTEVPLEGIERVLIDKLRVKNTCYNAATRIRSDGGGR